MKQSEHDLVDKGWVPLLDEHILCDDDGNPIMNINEEKLTTIANNMNKKIKKTGDWTPIVIGHTKEGKPEKEQPKVVGFSTKYAVKQFFNTGKKAIFGKLKFIKNLIEEAKDYPRRSVELWLNRMELDPISILGATTPARDLGLLRFSKTSGLHYSRSLPEDMTVPNDTQGIVQQVLAALQETDVWKGMEALLDQMQQGGGEGDENLPDDTTGEGTGTIDPAPGTPSATPPTSPQAQQQYAAPSGTNTYVPGGDTGDQSHKRTMEGAKKIDRTWGIAKPPQRMNEGVKFERDQLAGDVVKFQRAYVNTQKELNDMKIKFQRIEREKDLIQLESEDYIFDREQELNDVEGLDEAAYQKHINKIKLRYARSPVSNTFPRIAEEPVDSPVRAGHMSRDDMNRVVAFATANNLSYENALAKLNGEHVS